jgi:superfamily I DNA/RNA helicase
MPLPTPIGRQREVLYLSASGHTVVLGTAGSGKTTLAILRAAYLADARTEHSGPTLLVTFNNTLVTYLKYLYGALPPRLRVETYHKFARGYLASRGQIAWGDICTPEQRDRYIGLALSQVAAVDPGNAVLKRPLQFFSEELRWIAQNGIDTREDYEAAERYGRSVRLERKSRGVVFDVFECYRKTRERYNNRYDWDDLAIAVLQQLKQDVAERRYRHIVIDEGQDFSPVMIRSLVEAVPMDGSVTFFGDVAQQIYGHRVSWRSAGLKVNAIWPFEQNYRNTKQIADLALAIAKMPYFQGGPDIVAPKQPPADGPLPTIARCKGAADEIQFVTSQAKKLGTTRSVAILLPDRDEENAFFSRLPKNTVRLHKEMSVWRAGPAIFVGTYFAGKGLEFDTVFLPFCSTDRMPEVSNVAAFGEDDAMARAGRLLYVGVTRARSNLILTFTGELTSLLPPDPTLVQTVML